jgi:hypothetical protein
MNEDALNNMRLNELFDLLVKSVNELLDMHKNHEHVSRLDDKRQEIEILQKVILAKRAKKFPVKQAPDNLLLP